MVKSIDTTQQGGPPIRLTSRQAHDPATYRAAKERAMREGKALIIPGSLRPRARGPEWSPFKWMCWLVKFSSYAKCNPGARRHLRTKAQSFPKGTWTDDGKLAALTDGQACALANEVASALRVCARDETWQVPQSLIAETRDDRERDRRLVDIYAERDRMFFVSRSFETAFFVRVAELIAATGRSVRLCARPGCYQVFAVLRAGKFCSRRCAQHVATTAYRKNKEKKRLEELWKGLSDEKRAELAATELKRQARREEAKRRRLERKAGIDPDAPPLDPAEAKRRLLGIWPQHPPTMKVRHKRLGLVTINVGDFDPDVHTAVEGEGERE